MINSKAIRENLINNIVEELAKDGYKVINHAFDNKWTGDDKMNEHDAFVYGVFFDGMLRKYGFLEPKQATEKANGWRDKGIPSKYGRDWAEEAIKDYKPKKNGFELVVLVATFYSKINEGRGYKVISQVFSDVSNLSNDIKGSKMKVIGL